MPTLSFDIREYGPYLERLGRDRAMAAGRRGALSAALRGVLMLQQRTDRAPPADPGGKGTGGAVNIGHYRRAWRATALEDGAYLFNEAPYAGVIERGRRAGTRMPPTAAIARWAQRRLGLSEKDAARAAYVIARAIAKRGLRARRVLKDAIPELRHMVGEEITRELAAEMGRK